MSSTAYGVLPAYQSIQTVEGRNLENSPPPSNCERIGKKIYEFVSPAQALKAIGYLIAINGSAGVLFGSDQKLYTNAVVLIVAVGFFAASDLVTRIEKIVVSRHALNNV